MKMRVALEFDIEEDDLSIVVPSVSVYVVAYTANGIIEIVDEQQGERISAKGTNAEFRVITSPHSSEE